MLDTILSVVGGVTNLVLGLLGLLVATKRPTKGGLKWFATPFVIVGLVGLGGNVWLAYRSSETIRRVLAGLEAENNPEGKLSVVRHDFFEVGNDQIQFFVVLKNSSKTKSMRMIPEDAHLTPVALSNFPC